MMHDVIIICEDSFWKDIYFIIECINKKCLKYNVIGLICNESNFGMIETTERIPLLGTINSWNPISDEYYVMGIRNPYNKEYAAKTMMSKGCAFCTLVAPWMIKHGDIQYGEGCILAGYSIKPMARIGNFVTLYGTMLDVPQIDDFCTLEVFSNVTNAKIKKRVYIESHAVVMDHVEVEDDVLIKSGSIVLNRIKKGSKVAGNPARKIRR